MTLDPSTVPGPAPPRLPAEIDCSVTDRVGADLREYVWAHPRDVVPLDLGGVTFVDSSGLTMLIEVTKQTGKRLRLLNVGAACRRVFTLTDTARLFGVD
jgi:anti-anti-sigma factor